MSATLEQDPVAARREASADSIFGDDDALNAIFAALESQPFPICGASGLPANPEASKPWVLCIDDDADFSSVLRLRLEAIGVSVINAFTGMDGFQKAFSEPASAILLDFNMPNGQGDYILQRLKRNPVTMDIPVIVLTGNKDQQLQRRMLSMGAAAFLTKPLEFEDLLAVLQQQIDLPAPAGV